MNFLQRYFRMMAEGVAVPLQVSARHYALLQMLLKREVVNRSSGTALGRLWPLLQPALQVLGFWFLFDIVYGMRNRDTGPPFVNYLLTGMLPWLCMTEVMTRSSGVFREFSTLYRRSPFPIELLPVLMLLIPGLIYTLVYASVCLLLYGFVPALLALLVIPLVLVWMLPLVYLFSVLGLFLRDFAQTLPFLLMLVMYTTPILYFPSMLPDWARHWMWVNPLADLMATIHALVQREAIPWYGVLRLGILWLVLLAPGWLVFKRSVPHVRELL